MKRIKKSPRGKVTVFAAVGAIGVATLLYSGVTAVAANAALSEQRDIPTTYSLPSITEISAQPIAKLPDNNAATRKFTITDNSLEYYRDKKPTANDITREQAADIGMKELEKVFGVNLTGKTVAMAYDPAEDGMRAQWSGEFLIKGDWKTGEGYSFSVDSVTGELHSIHHLRSLSTSTSLDYDAKIAKDPSVFQALAKATAEEHSIVSGKVKSAAYAGQGYQNNDPEVMIKIVGENGQRSQLQFSRFDQALLSIMYQPAIDELDSTMQRDAQWANEMEDRAKVFFKNNPESQFYTEDR